MLSQTAEYALRAVVFLAGSPARLVTTREIAAATRVQEDYLAKVLVALVRGGVVRSRRGAQGGFALARAPEDLTVLDVVNVVDPIQRIDRCPLGLWSHRSQLCPLHRRLDEAAAIVEGSLRGSRISEMMERPPSPACGWGTVGGVGAR
jgi:Rrf2 family protein